MDDRFRVQFARSAKSVGVGCHLMEIFIESALAESQSCEHGFFAAIGHNKFDLGRDLRLQCTVSRAFELSIVRGLPSSE